MIRRTSSSSARRTRSVRTASRPPSAKAAQIATVSSKHQAWPLLVVVVIVATVLCYVTFLRFTRPAPNTPQGQASGDEIDSLVKQVSKHVSVRTDERPTVATVEDANLLRQQRPAFYQEAENGDKLLVWSDKAVLYSPRREVVLAVLPIAYAAIGEGSTTPAPDESATTTAQEERAPTVEVRNGTNRSGLARGATDKLKADGFTTLAPGDAKDRSYAKTVYYIKGGSFPVSEPKLLKDIAAERVETLPGERASEADIVVILGSDYQP